MSETTRFSEVFTFKTYKLVDGKLEPRPCFGRLGVGMNAMGSDETIFIEMGDDDSLGTTGLAIQLDGSLVRYGGCNSSYLETDMYGRIVCRNPLVVRRVIDDKNV